MALAEQEKFPNPRDESAVMAAWEAFLKGDDRPSAVLRSLVDVSWQRCLQASVNPHLRAGPQPLSDADLCLLRERRRELLDASAPVMACAHDFLAETGTLMALADAQGNILEVEGDLPAMASAETIRLMPGVNWSETLCGTNAIGTALALAQPVQIHSAEHFCEGVKRWTCSATVLRHPADGTVLGAIDVSGLSQTYHRQSLAFATVAASRIESRLAMKHMEQRYRLLDHVTQRWPALSLAAVVLFDHRGCPVKASPSAQAVVADWGGRLDLAGGRPWPGLAALNLGRDHHRQELPAWVRPEWLEPLHLQGMVIGTLLHLPTAKRRTPTATVKGTDLADGFAGLLHADPVMVDAVTRARQLSRSRSPVLLLGETGVGKDVFARGIHGASPGPYVALNCGGLSRELLASELFGYADGAFTGARKGGMPGKIEAADGGTLFLDEIGEMPLDMQSHLLRVLDQGELYRLGDNTLRRVRFRLVAATHRDLKTEVAAGRFRMDLYYRVAVSTLRVPPLRERPQDIALLAQHFLARCAQEAGRPGPLTLSPEALQALQAHAWPGNVRELRNVIEAAVWGAEQPVLGVQELGLCPAEAAPAGLATEPLRSMAETERAQITAAVVACRGNLTQAARVLNIAKSTLYAKMQRHGLTRGQALG